jgi:hypothetical protein
MNKIPNSGPNLEITSATAPSKNSSHYYRTPVFDGKISQEKCKNYASKYSKFSLSDFLQLPITFSFLDPNTFLMTLFSNTLNLRYSLRVTHKFHINVNDKSVMQNILWSYASTPPYILMAQCLIKHRVTLPVLPMMYWPWTVKLAYFWTENEPTESRTIFLQQRQIFKKIQKKIPINSSLGICNLMLYYAILCYLHTEIQFIAFVSS